VLNELYWRCEKQKEEDDTPQVGLLGCGTIMACHCDRQIGYYIVDNVNDTESNVVESEEDSPKRLPSLGNIFNLVVEALLSTDEIGEYMPILAPIRMIQTILEGTSRLSKSLLMISR
jgi:hypothetical protein